MAVVEPPSSNCERVLCYSTLLDESKSHTTLFRHPVYSYSQALTWPPANWEETDCWHCCSRCDHPPVPMAQDIDPMSNRYVCYGIFCSFACAKGYLFETQPWSAGDKILLLEDLAHSVFNVTEPILPAPPRQRLRRFGGDLDLQQLREHCKYVGAVFNPPLISYPETYEKEVGGQPSTTSNEDACWNVRPGVRTPSKPMFLEPATETEENISHASRNSGISFVPSPYASFCKGLKGSDAKSAMQPAREESAHSAGTLVSFMKPHKQARKTF